MRRYFAIGAVFALSVVTLGCGAEQEEITKGDPQELAWLRQTGEELVSQRRELAELRSQQLEAPVAGAAAASSEEEPAEGLGERIEALEERIGDLSEGYYQRLVAYINSLEIVYGEEPTAEQLEAIRMKSDEDIAIAQEWIERGGDYRRALDIYGAQLAVDPDYDRLLAARDRAQEMRFMTEERFAQVERGMSKSEVREVLGPVNLHNIREYPERNAEAWFYPREGGAAAGVYFQLDPRQGIYVVYQTNFEIQAEQRDGAQT